MNSSGFLVTSLGFSLCGGISSANRDSFTSFPIWISFHFLLWLLWLELLNLCWKILPRVDILVLFLILEEMLSIFNLWEWYLLWVCHIWPLLCWGSFPLWPISGALIFFVCFFNQCMLNFVTFCQFPAYIEMIWFLPFSLLMWCVTLIDLWTLENPCIPVIDTTWSWHMILLMGCWIQCASIFSRRRQWHPTAVLSPGKSHEWRSLLGYSPWGR